MKPTSLKEVQLQHVTDCSGQFVSNFGRKLKETPNPMLGK